MAEQDGANVEASLRSHTTGDPFPYYDRQRAEQPVRWDQSVGGWVLMAYSDCAAVGRQDDVFRVPWDHLPGGTEVLGRYGLFNLHGAPHRRLHTFLLRYLQKGVEGPLQQLVGRKVEEVADRIVGKGNADLAAEFADSVTSRVIMSVLGLEDDDDVLAVLFDANQAVKAWIESYGAPQQTADAIHARARIADSVGATISARRHAPQDDMLSALWRAGRAEFPDWNDDDMIGYVLHLFGAGSETTATLLCNIVCLVAGRPDVVQRLEGDGSAAGRLVEEVLRLWAPAHVRVREAATDVELRRMHIARGERVYPVLAAANRDPERFAAPAELDLDRARPTQHLAFYLGERFCVGAPLARLEGSLFTRTLISRFRNLRFQPGAPPPAYDGFSFRSFRPLNMCWDAAAPAG